MNYQRNKGHRAAHQLLWWLHALTTAADELCAAYWMQLDGPGRRLLARMDHLKEELPILRDTYRPRIKYGPFYTFDATLKRREIRVPRGAAHPAYGIQSYAPFGDVRTAKRDYARRLVRLFVALVNDEAPQEEGVAVVQWREPEDQRRAGGLFRELFLDPLKSLLKTVEREVRRRLTPVNDAMRPDLENRSCSSTSVFAMRVQMALYQLSEGVYAGNA